MRVASKWTTRARGLAVVLCLTAPLLGLQSATVLAAPEPQSQADDPLAEAQRLYEEGRAKFDAADYAGAIDAFTEALSVVQQLPEPDEAVRLSLLYNIASAHERAYEIDHDAAHLRQALTLYERYEDFADETGDLKEQLDVGVRTARLRRTLEELDSAEPEPAAVPAPSAPPRQEDAPDWKRARNVGLGLVVGGSLGLVGGIVLAVVGSRYEGNAEDQVAELNDLGVPPDHPAWAEGDDFIAQEARKGKTLMGVGGSLAAVGAVGVGVGVYQFAKAKRLREGHVSASAAVAPGAVRFSLMGRF